MVSYCTGAKTYFLNPLEHPCSSNSIKHIKINGGFKEFVPFLLNSKAGAPKRERRSISEEIIKEVGGLEGLEQALFSRESASAIVGGVA